jgi:imidazolonepropionase-like amidohydrolase
MGGVSAIVRGMRASVTAAAFIGLLVVASVPRAQSPIYDLLIKNGRLVDGTGSPWYRADVAVHGDTIARIAPRIDAPATRTIDAAGKVVSPGFIDLHTHARRGPRASSTPSLRLGHEFVELAPAKPARETVSADQQR